MISATMPLKSAVASEQVPEVTIPAQQEMTLKGVVRQFTPTVVECSMGGWIVILEGKGIAAKTSLQEATDFIAEMTFEAMERTHPSAESPKIVREWQSRKVSDLAKTVAAVLVAVFAVKPLGF